MELLVGLSEGHGLASRVVGMGMDMGMTVPCNALPEFAASLQMLLFHLSTCFLAVLAALR
jgi:hypothetical protein